MTRGNGITVIDCGVGNIQSVVNAFKRIGADDIKVASDGPTLSQQDPSRIILPGVGAVGAMLSNMNTLAITDALYQLVRIKKRPMLGICVGMQVLADTCCEFGKFDGLGWIPGTVSRLDTGDEELPLPHVGWNNVQAISGNVFFQGVDGENFYFVHSYAFYCPEKYVVATTEYGRRFVSAIRRDNIFAVQFHAEKSSAAGEAVLKNFMSFDPA